jgi:lipopolysaccharide/colanic/teichoic acid biosynthesis glycosyltransferase
MLMGAAHPKTLQRGHLLDSPWVQFPVILLFGVLFPPFILFGGKLSILLGPTAFFSIAASAVAAILTWYSLEKLRYFAKARRLSYVFPINCASFGVAFVVIGLLRLPYSSVVAIISFLSVLAVSFVIAFLTQKSGIEQWLVPGGMVDEVIPELDDVNVLDVQQMRLFIEHPAPRLAIVADLRHGHSSEWGALIAEAAINGIPVYHYRQILELQTGQVRIDHMHENNLGSLIPNLAYTSVKRIIDIVFSLFLLPFLLPVFAIIAILIKLDSRGPVFFHQERIGYRGRTFRMHKFRSMQVCDLPSEIDDKADDAITKTDDPRITGLGGFIRRYRIDELPQLVNILMGQMSWIGPRPEAESLSHHYQQKIPFYRYRHIVRPGISGWAQVNQGHVAAVEDVTEKLRYDFYYVGNISLWLDVLIFLKTLRIILGGFGAK